MYAKHLGAQEKSVSFPNTSKWQRRRAVCNRDLSGSSPNRTDGSQPWGRQAGNGAGTCVGSGSHRQALRWAVLACLALALSDMLLGSWDNFFGPLHAVVPFSVVCLYFLPLAVKTVQLTMGLCAQHLYPEKEPGSPLRSTPGQLFFSPTLWLLFRTSCPESSLSLNRNQSPPVRCAQPAAMSPGRLFSAECGTGLRDDEAGCHRVHTSVPSPSAGS